MKKALSWLLALAMVVVSHFGRPPRTALRSFVRLHTPEAVRLDRG